MPPISAAGGAAVAPRLKAQQLVHRYDGETLASFTVVEPIDAAYIKLKRVDSARIFRGAAAHYHVSPQAAVDAWLARSAREMRLINEQRLSLERREKTLALRQEEARRLRKTLDH